MKQKDFGEIDSENLITENHYDTVMNDLKKVKIYS